MIPFGPVYRELRASMLAVFPEDMPAPTQDGFNFSQWIEAGTYLVARHINNKVFLQVSRQDFAVALLRDVEFLVDSCFEQLLEILTHAQSTTRSPAWCVVACYYYAFYAAQAFSRIIGKPVTYLDDARIAIIRAISPTPISIGAGSFLVSKFSDVSVSQSEFEFAKSNSRPHDAVWKAVFHLLENLRASHKPDQRSSDLAAAEEYKTLGIVTSHLPFAAFVNGGFDWPAEVRYEANYRVGNAYTMLRRPWNLRPHTDMQRWKRVSSGSVLSLVQSSLDDFDSTSSTDGIRSRVRLMIDVANVLFALVRTLQKDIQGRRSTDSRWEHRRRRFCETHATAFEGRDAWLFPS